MRQPADQAPDIQSQLPGSNEKISIIISSSNFML